MDIVEIKNKKIELEKQISSLLVDFINETDLDISDIEVVKYTLNGMSQIIRITVKLIL